MTYADVQSVWLGAGATGGASGMGQASLAEDVGGTTTNTISSTGKSDSGSDVEVWEMKLESNRETVKIQLNTTMNDDAEVYKLFVLALHRNIAAVNDAVVYKQGGSLTVVAVVFISIVLFVLAAGAAFMGNATGLTALIGIGGALGVAGLLVLILGIKKTKPKAYHPLDIPVGLLPS